jgi:hypothetical protein
VLVQCARRRVPDVEAFGRAPLEMYWYLFVQPPVEVANLRTLTIDELTEHVAQARDAGVDAVMVDANFWSEIDSAERWAAVPDRLAPILSAAR